MDENLSWRARLLKANINIKYFDKHSALIYFDFAYRPHAGQSQKWASSIYRPDHDMDWPEAADQIRNLVTSLRKELED